MKTGIDFDSWQPSSCRCLQLRPTPPIPRRRRTPERSALDAEVQSLRREVVDLNRDLFMLEEDLLFPASTQIAVFVSMDVGTFFELDSVQLKMDGKEVSNYLYTERERDALKRGGVQRLWLGNLKAGEHELIGILHGKGHARTRLQARHDAQDRKGCRREVRGAARQRQAAKLQPEFVVRVWE